MADENKDVQAGQDSEKPGATKDSTEQAKPDDAAQDKSKLDVGADVPAQAQPLPPEAGTIAPAAEIEAKTEPGLPAGEEPKTEAKVENALPEVEKPSKTPTIEGATTEAGETSAPKPAAKPAPPRAPAAEKPAPPKAAPTAAHKPAGEKAPPARKGPTITTDITDDPFIERIKQRFGDSVTEAVATLGQQILRVKKDNYVELCRFLREDEEYPFDMCADLTAVHWPERAGQEFDVVAMLYCVSKNRRLRIKTSLADGEACPSVTPIWEGANWMEREVYDMFGIKFEGHPDLRRILLPPDWPGYPLRKEYPIEYRDNEWTDKHIQYREVDYDTSLIDVKYAERR